METVMSNKEKTPPVPHRASIAILEARFPGRFNLPLIAVGKLFGWAERSARNRLHEGKFSVPTSTIGSRRFARIDDVAAALDALSVSPATPRRRRAGRPSKVEEVAARARGLTVPQLRALEEEGGAQ